MKFPRRFIWKNENTFYNESDYSIEDEIEYNDDVGTYEYYFGNVDEEPIYNYYEPY